MASKYNQKTGQFRIAITEANGAEFQWRNIFFNRSEAEDRLDEAQAEFPTEDGHSKAVVQELFSTEDGETSKWTEVS
jgi:hypothetical protein